MPPYYSRIEPDPNTAVAYVELARLVDEYLAAGRRGDAINASRVLNRMRARFERQAVRNAQIADGAIRSKLRQTQKRPETPGGLDGRHLRDRIVSRPLPTTYPAGAIGIADVVELNRAINPRTGGVYWRAQEWGLPVTMRGAPAPGYFMPGLSRPNRGLFRVHPYFEQMAYARGMPALVRTRAVPARYYLRDGTNHAVGMAGLATRRIHREALSATALLPV